MPSLTLAIVLIAFLALTAAGKTQTNGEWTNSSPPGRVFIVHCKASEALSEGSWLRGSLKDDPVARQTLEKSKAALGISTKAYPAKIAITGRVTQLDGTINLFSSTVSGPKVATYEQESPSGTTTIVVDRSRAVYRVAGKDFIREPYSAFLDIDILPLLSEQLLTKSSFVKNVDDKQKISNQTDASTAKIQIYAFHEDVVPGDTGHQAHQTTLLVDKTTFLPVEEHFCRPSPIQPSAAIEVTRSFSDYKTENGVSYPAKIVELRGNQPFRTIQIDHLSLTPPSRGQN